MLDGLNHRRRVGQLGHGQARWQGSERGEQPARCATNLGKQALGQRRLRGLRQPRQGQAVQQMLDRRKAQRRQQQALQVAGIGQAVTQGGQGVARVDGQLGEHPVQRPAGGQGFQHRQAVDVGPVQVVQQHALHTGVHQGAGQRAPPRVGGRRRRQGQRCGRALPGQGVDQPVQRCKWTRRITRQRRRQQGLANGQAGRHLLQQACLAQARRPAHHHHPATGAGGPQRRQRRRAPDQLGWPPQGRRQLGAVWGRGGLLWCALGHRGDSLAQRAFKFDAACARAGSELGVQHGPQRQQAGVGACGVVAQVVQPCHPAVGGLGQGVQAQQALGQGQCAVQIAGGFGRVGVLSECGGLIGQALAPHPGQPLAQLRFGIGIDALQQLAQCWVLPGQHHHARRQLQGRVPHHPGLAGPLAQAQQPLTQVGAGPRCRGIGPEHAGQRLARLGPGQHQAPCQQGAMAIQHRGLAIGEYQGSNTGQAKRKLGHGAGGAARLAQAMRRLDADVHQAAGQPAPAGPRM